MLESYLSVEQVAEQLGYSPAHVRRLIRQKQLSAVKLGRWCISPEAIEKFIQRRSVISDAEKHESNHNI